MTNEVCFCVCYLLEHHTQNGKEWFKKEIQKAHKKHQGPEFECRSMSKGLIKNKLPRNDFAAGVHASTQASQIHCWKNIFNTKINK